RFKNSGSVLVSMDSLTQAISFSDFYADYQVPPGLNLLVTDLTTGEILSASDPAYTGKDATRVGLTEDVLKAGFAGDIVLNGKSCFVQTNVDGDRADVIASDLGYLARVYLPVVLGTIAAGLLAVAVMLTLLLRLQKPLWTDLPQRAVHAESREDADSEFYREQDGNLYTDRSAVGRWLDLRMPFQRQSADEKFRTLLCMLFLVLLAGAWIIHQHRDAGELMDSAFTYLLQRRWRYGLNIYAVTYALMQFCLIIAVGLILRRLILAAGSRLGNRGETIARLFGSFIAYASVIFAFARSLVFVGVNSTAILASAGIIGLAVSIGAKDLIADILAGIAIVFEGVFRTGDIVEIGGYRGTVEEVGIRTTKVMSMQNVKVFRNSNISGVINMTQRYSFAQVPLDVSRTQPLEKVEAVFRDALPEIRSRIPGTVSDIELVGIDQLNAKSMVLLFQTKCREADRVRVERQLRRELVLVMEREGMTAV
ncbi:MAG: mechanosensitive ion channel, partial [Oscillospiraceae bacterium]|nr:mechanosensitive ion channel [Oscillospiraceae bacterium]